MNLSLIVITFVLGMVSSCAQHSRSIQASYSLPVENPQRLRAVDYKSYRLQDARSAAKYKIAILDTGYNPERAVTKLKLCKNGHYDFFSETAKLASTNPHGTYVAALIAEPLQDVDYCAVVYQLVGKEGEISPQNVMRAILMAKDEGVVAANMSINGPFSNFLEQRALRAASNTGMKIFVAAGNDKKDLNVACASFPACYDIPNLIMVGALTDDLSQPAQYSNYGARIQAWYAGRYFDGVTMAQGTSFACPRALGDWLLSVASPLPR